MFAIETSDRQFKDGNGTSELGTILPAWWLNQIQAELLSVLGEAGIRPEKAKTNQLAAAIKSIHTDKLPAAALKFARPVVLGGNVAVNLDLTSRQSIIDAFGDAYINNGCLQMVLHNTSSNHNISGLPLRDKVYIQLDFYLMGGYSFIDCHYPGLGRSFRAGINWNNETLRLEWQENLNENNGVMLTADQAVDGAKTFKQILTAGRAEHWGRVRTPVKNGSYWVWEVNPDSALADGNTLRMNYKFEEDGQNRYIYFPALGGGNQTVAYQDWVSGQINAAAGNAVKTSGAQTVGGVKTFTESIVTNGDLHLRRAGNARLGALGMGGDDVYLHNSAAGKYLQLKNSGQLQYSGVNVLLASDLSAAVNLADAAKPASAAAVKTAHDKAAQAAPAGTVMYFAGRTPPPGWLKANGAAVSRSVYADLFAAIGTTYGAGNGSTTFTLPDLRGVFPRGWDDGRGFDNGRGIGSLQNHQLAEHRHAVGWRVNNNGNEFALIRSDWAAAAAVAADVAAGFAAVIPGDVERYEQVLGNTHTGTNDRYATTRAYYDVQGETRPANVALLACIKI